MSLLSASMQAAHLAGEDPEPDFAEDYEVDRSRVRVEFPSKLRGLFQPKRFKVMYGGRGGAKSWSVAMALLVMGSNRPLRILCAREIQKSMRDSVHRLLSDQIAALGLGGFYEVLDTEIRGANGTLILFAGLQSHTVDSIKSYEAKGRNTSVVGAHFACLNAAIQGNKRMLETLAVPAGRKIMMGGVALGMASAMAGYLMMGGGDGADDEWKKIPQFVEERAIIIPLGRQDYVAIPLPLGFHVFPNIGRTIVEMGVHDDPTKSRMGHVLDMAVLALDAYNPLGGSADLGQMASPTWFDPVLALARNKDWTGREIYREDRNSNDPTPGASRVKDSTAKPYRWLATFANAVTGGNEWRPGAASPTPEAIEYLVEQITGGVGREVNKAVAMTTSVFTGEELAPHQIVLAGRLYGNTRGANGQSNAYYENLKRINISENEFQARVQRGEDADAVLADVPLARAHDAAKALDKKISDLRNFRRTVQAGDSPDKRDQIKAINLEIELSMRQLNRGVLSTLSYVRKD